MRFTQTASAIAVSLLLSSVPSLAQTFSSCNPLLTSTLLTSTELSEREINTNKFAAGCPSDTALGKSISIDFTKGAVDSFTASGNPTYDSNGVSFTVAKSGDSPTLISKFYIMFGMVSITMKVAPGAGIVSTLVLQSDDLDEIDMEWLGADDSEVQTNYFGKGNTATYDRGAFNPAPSNQEKFVTYSVEYTAEQVVWSVGGNPVRTMPAAKADAGQYPQTPMQIKFGAWSGGDPSNPAGTIGWARGPTDYSKGPFTMTVQSIDISDYSTGTAYVYSGTSGNWQDILAVGGSIGSNKGSTASAVAVSPSSTSASPSIPVGGFGNGGAASTVTKTSWPWVASTTLSTATAATSTAAGIPDGWTVSSSGKVVPANSAAVSEPSPVHTSYPLSIHANRTSNLPPKLHPLLLRRPFRPLLQTVALKQSLPMMIKDFSPLLWSRLGIQPWRRATTSKGF